MLGWLPRRGERLFPAVSALLLALSFPPLHPLVVPFVGLVPLAVWLTDLPPGRVGSASAVRGGLLFGAIYFGLVFHWVLPALASFTPLAIPLFLAALAIVVVMAGALGGVLHHATQVGRLPGWVVLPAGWTALEWARAHLPSTLAFPWLGLGTSLTAFPELVGIAEIVGARGVTFWIVLVNALVAGLALRVRSRGDVGRSVLALGLVLALPMSWGVWRAWTLETRSIGRVAIVQPDVAPTLRRGAVGRDSTRAAIARLIPTIEPGSVALVALPEMTFTVSPRRDHEDGSLRTVQAMSRETGAPVLFGAYGREPEDEPVARVYNSAFLMEPRGLTDYQYDKHRLVPLVERAPFTAARRLDTADYAGAFAAGEGWPLAIVDETAFGVLICYESSFPELARAYRRQGADVLVNMTNDTWYGDAPGARSVVVWQHPAHMVMRAIENRVGVVRAANSGISLFIDPLGRIYEPTGLFEETVRVAEVRTSDVVTTYSRFGDVVGFGSAIFTLLLGLMWMKDLRSSEG